MIKKTIEAEYKTRFPQHAYATNDLQFGIRMYPAAVALTKAIVQHNYKHSLSWLVYDLDRPAAAVDWDDWKTPPPNIIAVNKDNGHAHFFYGLEYPVHNYEGASQKALRYMGAVDVALTKKLGADPGYSKLLSKNPTHDRWVTIYPRSFFYDLDELADWLDLEKYQDRRKRLPAVGYGRNSILFDRLRLWAYRERRQPYLSEEMFHSAVLNHGLVLNAEFEPPLPHSEVRATAKSVARWTWRKMSAEGFRAYQSAAGKRSGSVRQNKAQELRKAIVSAVNECPALTQEDIAAMFGIRRETVNRHLKAYKKECDLNHIR